MLHRYKYYCSFTIGDICNSNITKWENTSWQARNHTNRVFQFKYLIVMSQLIELKMNPVLEIENSVLYCCGILVADLPLWSSNFWTWMFGVMDIQKHEQSLSHISTSYFTSRNNNPFTLQIKWKIDIWETWI